MIYVRMGAHVNQKIIPAYLDAHVRPLSRRSRMRSWNGGQENHILTAD